MLLSEMGTILLRAYLGRFKPVTHLDRSGVRPTATLIGADVELRTFYNIPPCARFFPRYCLLFQSFIHFTSHSLRDSSIRRKLCFTSHVRQ